MAPGGQASNTFTSVGAGPHTVTVVDAQGCTVTINVTVGNLPALVATATTTPSGCSPSGTATVTVPAGIGVAPFLYAIDLNLPQAGNSFGSLSAGSHSITVSDAVGCTYTFSVTVDSPTPLVGTVSVFATSCNGASNGAAVLHPQNGIAPFQYQIGTNGWQVSDSFPNLAPGVYDLSYRDASGCVSGLFQATITAGPQITATTTHSDVFCFGGSNGTATVTLSANATGPYQFSVDNWATSQSSNVVTGFAVGTFTIWFRDALGCANSTSVTIGQPTQLVAGTPITTNPQCANGANGSVTLSASGGIAPYTYSFNNGPFFPTALFPSGAGTFNAVIRDANNCTVTVNGITVTDPPALVIDSVRIGDATCDTMGRLTVFPNGGTFPYRFQLDNGMIQRDSAFKAIANTYQITVRDTNNCMIQRFVTINQVNNLTYTRPIVSTICEGSSSILAPVSNATHYSWSGPALTPNNAVQSSVTVRPIHDTVYHLVYSLGTCSNSDDIPVSVLAAPIPDAGTVSGICSGQNTQLNATPGFVTYVWSPINYLSGNIAGSNPDVIRPLASVTYFLHVVDANGCASLIPDTVTVPVTPPIQVYLSPRDTVGYIGDTLHLHASANAISYVWTNAQNQTPPNLTNANIANPVLLVEHNEVLKVHVTDAQGCTGDGFFYLQAYQGPEIYVPTAFSPNRDGKNDLLRPVCVGVNTLNYFRVFDRWGKVMYEYTGERRGPVVYNMINSNIGWDGKLGGKELGTGSYVWVAEGVTKEGKTIFRKGVVTIIR
jgi:gliding motility-associated-like protein